MASEPPQVDPNAPLLRIGVLEFYSSGQGDLWIHADGEMCETIVSEQITYERAVQLRELLARFTEGRL